MQMESHSLGKAHHKCSAGIQTRLKEVSNGLNTSKELLKVLNHVWGLQEQTSSGISVLSALRIELDRARNQVDQLIREQRSNRNEIEYLMKHFAEEKAAWKMKERDRILGAIACIAEELEVEKKLRRQTERLNKKLGKELADTKASLSKAMKEVKREKRAREILEQICDELARGIGEDRAQVEELKRESAKVREEVEKEREMLQLADVLREERVQMKLSEAKYQFEEKNAAVEKLRNELEVYLKTKGGKENSDASPKFEKIKELEAYLKKINFGSSQNAEKEEDEGEVADGEDSGESDLHSIELNMDNTSKSYKWCYVHEDDAQDDSRKVSVDKESKGRKSLSEKIQWGSICFNRGTSNGDNFGPKSRENSDRFDQERLSEMLSQAQTQQEHDDEIRRSRSLLSLSDRILSGSKIAFSRSLPFQDPGNDAWESSMVLHGDDLKPDVAGTRGQRMSDSN
jgi:chromosome segregation ATPase